MTSAVVQLNPQDPQVELLEHQLVAREISFEGTIVEVARDKGLEVDSRRLARLLTEAVEIGATVLRNGQSRALVESVAAEIDRLIDTASSESEKIPKALEAPLTEHLTRLAELLAGYLDPKRARSLQSQIKTLVGEATKSEMRNLMREVLGADGAMGSQLRLVTSSSTDTLTRLNTLLDKLEQNQRLDAAFERSTHKGRPFEEVVQAELEAIHGPLGDRVLCVRSEYGNLPKAGKGAKAGDFVVVLNPEHTRGHEVVYVVEAKTGRLSASEAKRELDTAMTNRGAVVGVIVFDDLADAPLGGRSFMPHGDGRFTAVLEIETGIPLALEVAAREARTAAIASVVAAEGQLDPAWVQSHCNRLCEAVEEASGILRSVGAVERAARDIRGRYTQMRAEALGLIDELRERAER
jgi:hypothetical protein